MTFDRFGLVPPEIRNRIEGEMMQNEVMGYGPVLDELQKMDDKIIDLRRFGDDAPTHTGAKPNRWHVYRDNGPPVGPSYIPIETPDGGYREPDSGIIEELKQRDMWRRRVGEYTTKMAPAAFRDGLRDEQADYEMAEDVKAGLRVAGEGGLTGRKWGRG
jgi:hypothetical protein